MTTDVWPLCQQAPHALLLAFAAHSLAATVTRPVLVLMMPCFVTLCPAEQVWQKLYLQHWLQLPLQRLLWLLLFAAVPCRTYVCQRPAFSGQTLSKLLCLSTTNHVIPNIDVMQTISSPCYHWREANC